MPSYIVKQPDGRLARFSTIVDQFTHLNMSEAEATEVLISEAVRRAQEDAAEIIQKAIANNDRWQECLDTVHDIHGPAAVQVLEKEITT